MVERITDPHRPVSLRHGVGRLPDGRPGPYGVPQPEPAPPGYYPPRRGGVITTIAACAVIVAALMAAGIAGVWS